MVSLRIFRIIFFKIRSSSLLNLVFSFIQKIDGLTSFSPIPYSSKFTWPHKVYIGKKTVIEHNVFFKHDGPYSEEKSIIIGNHIFIGSGCEFNIRQKITVKDHVLIASGCRFIDHDHGIDKNELIRTQHGPEGEIMIEEDVWIGANVVVLKGVTIGKGVVVAAGAVVNKSIPDYEIWGGVPAKKISERK